MSAIGIIALKVTFVMYMTVYNYVHW